MQGKGEQVAATAVATGALATSVAITINGQAYDPVDAHVGGFEWQLEMMRVTEEAGLFPFLVEGGLSGDLEQDAFQIFRQLLRSRRIPQLFAVLYVARGTEWTEAGAAETEARIRKAAGVDTAALRTALTQLVLAFFLNGAPSKTISRTSSAKPKGPAPTRRGKSGRGARGARGTTASGTRSSGRSRGTTRTD